MEIPSPTQNNHPTGSTFGSRRAAANPAFESKLRQMALPLAPLVQLTTGAVHPWFPPTLLAFWLLTNEQLDALASFYHQRTPSCWTVQYPCPVSWHVGLTLDEKRRRIGKFIGLRGCETPVAVVLPGMGSVLERMRSEAELEEEARRRRAAEEEEEEVKRKMRWY
ncbi:hypothetical protein B0T25DRAFT_24781 [Lasiosphaeria hispida]|uniref:Beta-xylosidase n=1 Tax=Lasiosphaeria hispida TaxID=260671 RepID=A0AAJ0HUH1_9PEZI|nr:hypothetical protein B0T25DRAFT_24781 [Lasiosphaeria hispida]